MYHDMKNTLRQTKRWTSAHNLALLISLGILIIGAVISSLFAREIHTQNTKDFSSQLTQQRNTVKSYISDMADSYNQLLISGATLFNIKSDVTRQEWARFYSDMQVEKRYPSTLGVGYVQYVKADGLDDYQSTVRAEGYDTFQVTPTDARPEYTSITYIEPFNEINKKAFGYDMFSEPIRRSAMEIARDTGGISMTAPVKLVQDGSVNTVTGVLIYQAIYASGKVPDTMLERRANLRGYVYVAFRPKDIISAHMQNSWYNDETVNTILQDATGSELVTLYENKPSDIPRDKLHAFSDVFTVENRQWRIEVQGRDTSFSTLYGPGAVFFMGMVLSTAVSYFILRALLMRLLKVEKTFADEVQRSKDELIALASHQLRTPASGVKMYIGMLLEGMMGNLDPQQQVIAQKAYDINERQIEIVDELLYVSKADAGQLHVVFEKTNLSSATRKIIESISHIAKAKNVTLDFRGKKIINAEVDIRYWAMIVENLISNAIKYSPEGSKVKIKLAEDNSQIILTVEDNGVGIAESDLDHIFDKFTRIENVYSHSEGGSGLGLYLARQLAESHKGSLSVESTVGEGSTFSLVLPKKTHKKSLRRSNSSHL